MESFWKYFNADRVWTRIMKRAVGPHAVEEPPGTYWVLKLPLHACDLIVAGFPSRLRQYARDVIHQEIDEDRYDISVAEFGIQDVGDFMAEADTILAALLRGPGKDRSPETENVIECWTAAGMPSSAWWVNLVSTEDYGFVFYNLGEGTWEDQQLLGWWSPGDNPAARKKCLVAAYLAHWADLRLPPEMGECASGEQPLFMECVLELLQHEQSLWKVIGQQTPMTDPLTEERFEFVQRLTGILSDRLKELFARAGAGKEDPNSSEVDDGETDEEEAYAELNMLVAAAPVDPESARFLLANYLYFLQYAAEDSGRLAESVTNWEDWYDRS